MQSCQPTASGLSLHCDAGLLAGLKPKHPTLADCSPSPRSASVAFRTHDQNNRATAGAASFSAYLLDSEVRRHAQYKAVVVCFRAVLARGREVRWMPSDSGRGTLDCGASRTVDFLPCVVSVQVLTAILRNHRRCNLNAVQHSPSMHTHPSPSLPLFSTHRVGRTWAGIGHDTIKSANEDGPVDCKWCMQRPIILIIGKPPR